MTDFEKQQIRNLLWKEWRAIRDVVILCLALVVSPCFLAILFWESRVLDLILAFLPTASVLACIGLGIQSYGLEFNERTSAYLCTRPISHTRVFLVKALIGLSGAWAVGIAAALQAGGIAGFLAYQSKPIEGVQWLIEWQIHWLFIAPATFLLVQVMMLLIPPMVPALIASIAVGLLTPQVMMGKPTVVLPLMPVLLVGLGFLCYHLARWRMRHATG
ncbi:MAG: hypothetical protein HUU16_00650 [Candidatus Omnitrophica bacterium]|nr:hypothetical protein [bacterium]NUN94658.1 hypothetical protein [Candidatus Omnitrophota bacterium]